jgi:hypothetical protein
VKKDDAVPEQEPIGPKGTPRKRTVFERFSSRGLRVGKTGLRPGRTARHTESTTFVPRERTEGVGRQSNSSAQGSESDDV